MRDLSWSNGDIELLIALYETDTPIREIASRLRRTKNAIVSRANRLSLRRPPQTVKPFIKGKSTPPVPIYRNEASSTLYGTAKTLLDVKNGECRWMVGKLCCADKVFKRNLCKNHFEISYIQKERKEDV